MDRFVPRDDEAVSSLMPSDDEAVCSLPPRDDGEFVIASEVRQSMRGVHNLQH